MIDKPELLNSFIPFEKEYPYFFQTPKPIVLNNNSVSNKLEVKKEEEKDNNNNKGDNDDEDSNVKNLSSIAQSFINNNNNISILHSDEEIDKSDSENWEVPSEETYSDDEEEEDEYDDDDELFGLTENERTLLVLKKELRYCMKFIPYWRHVKGTKRMRILRRLRKIVYMMNIIKEEIRKEEEDELEDDESSDEEDEEEMELEDDDSTDDDEEEEEIPELETNSSEEEEEEKEIEEEEEEEDGSEGSEEEDNVEEEGNGDGDVEVITFDSLKKEDKEKIQDAQDVIKKILLGSRNSIYGDRNVDQWENADQNKQEIQKNYIKTHNKQIKKWEKSRQLDGWNKALDKGKAPKIKKNKNNNDQPMKRQNPFDNPKKFKNKKSRY